MQNKATCKVKPLPKQPAPVWLLELMLAFLPSFWLYT